MDILSHTFTGVASVSLGLCLFPFSTKQKVKYLTLGAFCGAFPDIDAVSMWSKWDSVFSTVQKGNKIYTDSHWYSHHGFFHSLLAGVALVLFFIFVRFVIIRTVHQKKDWFMYLFLFIGFLGHLLEDMPTPYSMWGGVRFFFPSDIYVGGFGKIWWWNNYDIFLLIFVLGTSNTILSMVLKDTFRFKKVIALSSTFVLVGFILYQINTRENSYAYRGYTSDYAQYEIDSKQEQKKILGESLFRIMSFIDSKLPVQF